MKKIVNRFEKLEKAAYTAIHVGLAAVAACSLALLSYVSRSESLIEQMSLYETLPALVLSALIVFGGGFALDAVLKENKDSKDSDKR